MQGPELGNAEVVCQADKGQLITSGGGFSTYYSTPSYQTSAVAAYFSAAASAGQSPVAGYKRTGRGFPDLSLAGYGYLTLVGGQIYYMAGTSASSPAIAGFFSNINAARIAAGKGALGFLNPALYANYKRFTNDITSGNNLCVASGTCCPQGFYAAPGWDPATGLGSVNYGRMQATLVALGNTAGSPTPSPAMLYASPSAPPSLKPTPLPTQVDPSPTMLPSAAPVITSAPTVPFLSVIKATQV